METNKEAAYIIRGAQGGIIIAFLIILNTLALYAKNFWQATSQEFISNYLLIVTLLALAGSIAGKWHSKNKSTKPIWLITYVILILTGIFQRTAEFKLVKETFAIFILFAIFSMLYMEITDYIWK